jgi:hypothetical protein
MTTRTRPGSVAATALRRRALVRALLTAAPFALAPGAHAAEPPRAPDAVDLDLLEFLGSGDDGDPELQSFLAAQPTTAAANGTVNTKKPATDRTAPGTGSTSR